MRTIFEYEGDILIMSHPCLDCGDEIEDGDFCEFCAAEKGVEDLMHNLSALAGGD